MAFAVDGKPTKTHDGRLLISETIVLTSARKKILLVTFAHTLEEGIDAKEVRMKICILNIQGLDKKKYIYYVREDLCRWKLFMCI